MGHRILVSGSEGFVGKVLCRRLRESGHDVFGCGRNMPSADAKRFQCDITEQSQIETIFDAVGDITHILHLAAMTFLPEAAESPVQVMRVNFEGTMNLAHTMQRHVPEARFVFVGSCQAYGPPQALPMTEAHPLHPDAPYGISKAAGDLYCEYLHKSLGLDVVRMRPFNHSGPGHGAQFSLPNFARQIARIEAGLQEPVIHVGNLNSRRDFMHVDDVCRAYELALDNAVPGEAYNVCSGQSENMQNALQALVAKAAVAVEVREDSARFREVDIPEIRGDSTKLHEATGWEPAISFDSLLDDLLGFWRERVASGE